MRRTGLVLAALILAAPAARADDDEEIPDGGAALLHCQAPHELKGDAASAYEPACRFFTAVATRNVSEVEDWVRAPFYFEGKQVNGLEDVKKKWRELLADVGRSSVPFYGLDVYTYDEMVKKYGKPPAKLENVPTRGAMVAVGNLDGRAAVALLHREGNSWSVYAYHD